MKKTCSLFWALSVCVALVGCGGDSGSSPAPSTSAPAAEEAAPAEEAEAPAEEAAEEAPAEEAAPAQ
ncbi:MAG: hypothetical protein KDA57_09305 [Planctomycetales bacterium]|nr:hypothetical protein [Planctomycetales bacterium]